MSTRSGKAYYGSKRKRSSNKGTTIDKNNSPNGKEVESHLNISSMSNRELRGRKTIIKDSASDTVAESVTKIVAGNATESNWIISSVSKKGKRKGAKGDVEKEPENDINVSNMVTKPLRRRKSNVIESVTEKIDKANTTYEKETDNNKTFQSADKENVCKNGTFNKDNLSVNGIDEQNDVEVDLNPDNDAGKQLSKKKRKVKGKKKKQKMKAVAKTSLDNTNTIEKDSQNNTFDKKSDDKINMIEKDLDVKSSKVSKKHLRNQKTNAKDISEKDNKVDTTHEKDEKKTKTFDKDLESDDTSSVNSRETKSAVNVTYDKNNDTFENEASTSFDTFKKGALTRKSSIRDKSAAILSLTSEELENDNHIISSSASKNKPNRRQTTDINDLHIQNLDLTFEKADNKKKSLIKEDTKTDKVSLLHPASKRKSFRRQTIHINDSDTQKLDSTLDKTSKKNSMVKEDIATNKVSLSSPMSKKKSLRRQTIDSNNSETQKSNSTFDKASNNSQSLIQEDFDTATVNLLSPASKRKSFRRHTIHINDSDTQKLDLTLDKTSKKNSMVKEDIATNKISLSSTMSKKKSLRRQTIDINNSETQKSNSTFDKTSNNSQSLIQEDFDTATVSLLSPASKRKSFRRQTIEIKESVTKSLDSTFEKTSNNRSLVKEDIEIDKASLLSPASKRKSIRHQIIDINDSDTQKLDSTFEKTPTKKHSLVIEDIETGKISLLSPASKRKSIRRQTIDVNGSMTQKFNSTFDKISKSNKDSNDSFQSLDGEVFITDKVSLSSPASKRKSIRRQTMYLNNSSTQKLDSTYVNTLNNESESKHKSQILSAASTEQLLNTTFDKESETVSKSSLISSDNSVSVKSDISRISITSDDTVEDISNTTPMLIESSMEASIVKDPKNSPKPQTPLKREGTFTKEGPEVQPQSPQTPRKRDSSIMPPAGFTPYHVSKSSQKKNMFNVTRSIEKRSSINPAPRLTRVMFCSPVNNSALIAQEKNQSKVIKSNLKGSNKSFVFDETASISRPARKRSYTQSDADDSRAKRSRLTDDLQLSVNRLSRPRTTSAAAKLTDTTPKKLLTPFRSKSESKTVRTRLPNFAALHQKQFDKMESLDECQERKAKRAREMLTPNGPINVLDRISPKNDTEPQKPATIDAVKPNDKTDTPNKKKFTLESLRPGFTRFGFKLNLDIPNPFSVPPKTDKVKVKPNVMVPRQAVLPSLTGSTAGRREVAKQTVMREKSFQEKKRNMNRNENRTIIKGVRTNRRFELQMKLRNMD